MISTWSRSGPADHLLLTGPAGWADHLHGGSVPGEASGPGDRPLPPDCPSWWPAATVARPAPVGGERLPGGVGRRTRLLVDAVRVRLPTCSVARSA